MMALTENPMSFLAHPMASTATGNAVVTKNPTLTSTTNMITFMSHPMASIATDSLVVWNILFR